MLLLDDPRLLVERLIVPIVLLSPPLYGQGRCQNGYRTAACPSTKEVATAPIRPIFASTAWKTVALDHITFLMHDYKKEAAFFVALMGWKLYTDNGHEAVLDIGAWGSAVFKQATRIHEIAVDNVCWVIEPWNAKSVETELRARGLDPLPDNDSNGFESFHVIDPNGVDLQIANGNGLVKHRSSRTLPSLEMAFSMLPFKPTGWHTVWLDHISYNAADYKRTVSFYTNLLGWRETYDEGSQQELMIGDIGDIIIRGGNPNNPGGLPPARRERIDHISFGIAPWNTDGIKAALQQRRLRARIDTAGPQDIHVAAYKSYHTTTPNGFDIQISHVTQDTRLLLSTVVKP